MQKPAHQKKPEAPTPPSTNILMDRFRRNASLGAGQVPAPEGNKEKEASGEPIAAH